MYRSIYRGIQLTAKIVVFLIALLALCGVALIGLTQVDSFRTWLVTRGLEALNGQLQGKVEVGSTSGNLFTGLRLRDVRLHAANTTLLAAPVIDLKYQLLPLLQQRVIGAEVTIYRPQIMLLRNAQDSTWNFEHITKPSTDSIKTPFNWTIDVASLDIRDAKVSLHDLTVPEVYDTVTRAVNYQYLDVDQFNLSAQAHIAPTSQSVWIQNLAFNLPRPDVRVVELSGNISIDTTGLSLLGVRLQTGRTMLKVSGRVDSVNFFESGVAPMQAWKHYPISLELDGPNVSTLELKRFIPNLAFLGGTPSLKLSAHGRYGDLAITQLDLGLTHSHIGIEGRIKNLNVPDSLYIEARMHDTRLSYDDVPIYVPGLNIPNLAYLGPVTVRSAAFVGAPQVFTATVDASTDLGSAKGGAWLDARGDALRYNADVAFLHANLEPILKNPDLRGDLTGRAVINGTGTSLSELNSDVRLLLDGSTLADRSVRKLYVDATVRDGGFVAIDTLMAALGEKAGPPTVTPAPLDELERTLPNSLHAPMGSRNTPTGADLAVLTSSNSIATGGWIDFRNTGAPRYNVRIQGRELNPATILLDSSNASHLTFTAEVAGSGFDPDDIQGTGKVNVTAAEMHGKAFLPFSAEFALTRQDRSTRDLKVTSTLADIDIAGQWRFATIVPSVARGLGSIADYVGRKAAYREESVLFGGVDHPFTEPINANYKLVLKDLTPLELFLGGGRLEAEGDLAGDISGTPQLLSISANGTMRHLFYQKDSTLLRLVATTLQIDLRNITPNRIEDISSAQVVIRSDSVAQFNGLTFGAPSVSVALDAGLLSFRGSTAINGKVSVAVDGSVDATNQRGYAIRLDTMLVAIPGGNRWHNVGPVSAVLTEGGVTLDTFVVQRTFQRRAAEIVEVTGGLNGRTIDNVHLTVRQGSLKELPTFLPGDVFSTVQPLAGIVRIGDFAIQGTLDAPVVDGRLQIDSISYSGAAIGNLQAAIHYDNQNVQGRILVSDIRRAVGDTSKLEADIEITSFPIDLGLSAATLFPKSRPVDIAAHTDDLPIAFLAPFLPGVRIQGGIADVDFKVGGTMPDLAYSGTAQVNRARILVEGNNIVYWANARLAFEDQTLTIQQAVLQNDPRDLVGGLATVTGAVHFDGFSIKDIDINAETARLLVLSDATQAVNSTVYGDLVVATANGPLELTGSLDQPMLRGDVHIINGNLRFPENDVAPENTNVVKYIDFATWQRRTEIPYGPPADETDSLAGNGAGAGTASAEVPTPRDTGSLTNASQQLLEKIEQTTGLQTGGDVSLTDKILYELNIAVTGRLFITMDLSPVEQVQAEIGNQGQPLHLSRAANGPMRLTGTLTVLPGSKYNFLRSFDASGSITFKDNLDNPDLGLTANYSGRILGPEGTPQQEFVVTVSITGTLNAPHITFSYTIDGRRPSITDETEQTRNAITLLLFNRTSDQLGAGNVVGSTLSSTAGSTGSLAVSRVLSDIFTSSIGFIRSVSLDVGNQPGDFSRTRVNVVSQFGKLVLRYGGELSSPSDGIIAVDLPLSAITDVNLLRNIVMQFEREARTLETSSPGSPTTPSTAYRIRVQIRIDK